MLHFGNCDCCGSKENLVLGSQTLYDEFQYICKSCLDNIHAYENSNPLDVIQYELEKDNITDDVIYGFGTEKNDVIVKYFDSNRNLVNKVLYTCIDEDDAIDLLIKIA